MLILLSLAHHRSCFIRAYSMSPKLAVASLSCRRQQNTPAKRLAAVLAAALGTAAAAWRLLDTYKAADSSECEMAVFSMPTWLVVYSRLMDSAAVGILLVLFGRLARLGALTSSTRQNLNDCNGSRGANAVVVLVLGLFAACVLLHVPAHAIAQRLNEDAARRDASLTSAFDVYFCHHRAAAICSSTAALASVVQMFGGEAFVKVDSWAWHIGSKRAIVYENAFYGCQFVRERNVAIRDSSTRDQNFLKSCQLYQAQGYLDLVSSDDSSSDGAAAMDAWCGELLLKAIGRTPTRSRSQPYDVLCPSRSPSSVHDAVFDAFQGEWLRRFHRDRIVLALWLLTWLSLAWSRTSLRPVRVIGDTEECSDEASANQHVNAYGDSQSLMPTEHSGDQMAAQETDDRGVLSDRSSCTSCSNTTEENASEVEAESDEQERDTSGERSDSVGAAASKLAELFRSGTYLRVTEDDEFHFEACIAEASEDERTGCECRRE